MSGGFTYSNPHWWPEWEGGEIMIVASGPSAGVTPVEIAKDRCHTIAINTSVEMVPWADILFACDYQWWENRNGEPDFNGLRLSSARRACENYDNIHMVKCNRNEDRFLVQNTGEVGWGGNSGYQALNLAAQMRPSRIYLVGYDMRLDYGLHWHGDHPEPMHNPQEKNLKRWKRCLEQAHKSCRNMGIEVINCSLHSALRAYPKMTLQEALDGASTDAASGRENAA